jgi:hypothetical protein
MQLRAFWHAVQQSSYRSLRLELRQKRSPQMLTWADFVLQDKPGKPLRGIEQVLHDKSVSVDIPAISRQDSNGSLLCDAVSACRACTAVDTDDNSLRRPQRQTCYLWAIVSANLHNHAAAAYAVRGTAEAGQLKPAHGPE